MKNQIRLLALGALGMIISSCSNQGFKPTPGTPVFKDFTYTGKDAVYENNPLEEDEFYTPILQGCYPDPSICRKGNDYYLVCSSFAINPGVPIFHSTDLVNWKQIGHVLDRSSQLKVEDTGISAGIYAPTIRYNPNNDTFYMITTQFAGNIGNMIVKTKDPMKGWSDPIKLDFEGIDPDIFFDDNGKAYIVHNDAPEKALYEGHRVIKVWEYDTEKDQIIPGTDKVIVNGGVDLSKKPIWIEAPHLYKKGGKYYLMCAEGGTGDQHSEVIFISNILKVLSSLLLKILSCLKDTCLQTDLKKLTGQDTLTLLKDRTENIMAYFWLSVLTRQTESIQDVKHLYSQLTGPAHSQCSKADWNL